MVSSECTIGTIGIILSTADAIYQLERIELNITVADGIWQTD